MVIFILMEIMLEYDDRQVFKLCILKKWYLVQP